MLPVTVLVSSCNMLHKVYASFLWLTTVDSTFRNTRRSAIAGMSKNQSDLKVIWYWCHLMGNMISYMPNFIEIEDNVL